MKNGLLLINLGTPDTPDTAGVRRYLREFLSDPRVVDLPMPIRFFLVYFFILPFRPKLSAKAYQSIWTDKGSPLLVNSERLAENLQTSLGEGWKVSLGMRYGNPSLLTALNELKFCEKLSILPLYPQYSEAATGSSIERILSLIAIQKTHPSLHIVRDFFKHPSFIKALAESIKPYLKNHDFLLFSYHGVPERHILSSCGSLCEKQCPEITRENQICYKAQCQATTEAVANSLNLPKETYGMSFQSRLGRTPWIKPYTDLVLPELAQQGVKRLAITCPSFVVDCLETLEEIGLRAQEQWLQLGGEQLTLIPCLNDEEAFVKAIIDICGLYRFNNQ